MKQPLTEYTIGTSKTQGPTVRGPIVEDPKTKVPKAAPMPVLQTVGGRYRLVRLLGAGSFGRTYLARDMHLPGLPLCAVKQLITQRRTPFEVRRAQQLFEREAKVLQSLSHAQIPRLQAYLTQPEGTYLVQDLVIGRLVSDFVTPELRLSEIHTYRLLMSALNALAFLHGSGIIHRDIKPTNLIWRASDGEIVLIDFGTVEFAQGSAEEYSKGRSWRSRHSIVTSIGYFPEAQRHCQSCFSNDLYALGMTVIEAATGRPFSQFHDDRTKTVLQWRPWATHISDELAEAISRLVHPNARDRYPTAQLAKSAISEAVSTASLFKPSCSLVIGQPPPLVRGTTTLLYCDNPNSTPWRWETPEN